MGNIASCCNKKVHNSENRNVESSLRFSSPAKDDNRTDTPDGRSTSTSEEREEDFRGQKEENEDGDEDDGYICKETTGETIQRAFVLPGGQPIDNTNSEENNVPRADVNADEQRIIPPAPDPKKPKT